jgi:hypothetical protein
MRKYLSLLIAAVLGFLGSTAAAHADSSDMKIRVGERASTAVPTENHPTQPTLQAPQTPQARVRPRRRSTVPCPACGMG